MVNNTPFPVNFTHYELVLLEKCLNLSVHFSNDDESIAEVKKLLSKVKKAIREDCFENDIKEMSNKLYDNNLKELEPYLNSLGIKLKENGKYRSTTDIINDIYKKCGRQYKKGEEQSMSNKKTCPICTSPIQTEYTCIYCNKTVCENCLSDKFAEESVCIECEDEAIRDERNGRIEINAER